MLVDRRSDGGQGGGSDDAKTGHGGHRAVAGVDRVAQMFVQLGQGGCAEHDLVGCFEAVSGQQWRSEGGVRVAAEDRDGLPVDPQVLEADARPPLTFGILVEELGGLLSVQVDAAPWWFERVVPVPAVERGMRDERVEAGPERQRGGHDDDRQCRAEDGRAHGHRVAASPGFERETDARDRRQR